MGRTGVSYCSAAGWCLLSLYCGGGGGSRGATAARSRGGEEGLGTDLSTLWSPSEYLRTEL